MQLLNAGTVDRVTQTYTIRSEIDGEVIARTAMPGLEVQGQYSSGTSQELFTIGSLDRVWIIGNVYEMDLARVRVGAAVVVRVIAFPSREYLGQVEWISGVLDEATRSARIRCSVENRDGALRPQMFATVTVDVPAVSVLAIPRNALLRASDATIVFVDRGRASDGRFRFVPWPVVTDEGSNEPWLPVRRGLVAGDRVVSNNAIQLLGLLRESTP
jgi:multidrug efflux pump subunit AcrA (membrane-fusion protein)